MQKKTGTEKHFTGHISLPEYLQLQTYHIVSHLHIHPVTVIGLCDIIRDKLYLMYQSVGSS